jgi:hypothetical protein
MPRDSTVSIAIISFVVPLLLAWMTGAGSRGVVGPGEVRYSRPFRWGSLFVAFAPSAGVAVLAALQKDPLDADSLRTVVLLMLFFPVVSSPLLLELLRVRHRFNDVGLAYHSPWSAERYLEWAEVTSVRWRKYLKWLDLSTRTGVTVHLSPLLSGLGVCAATALVRIPPDVLFASSPDARAALRLMALGQAGPLLTSPQSPEQLLASATRR